MKKLFLAFALVACFAVSALSQGAPPWTIQEVDGSPRVNSPTLIKVTNGTLSCTGKTCTITISGGGGGGITIGTTTITSGTNTRVLYNNSGVVGEYTITGTGNVVMSAAPTLTGRVSAADGLFATSVTTGTGSSAGLQVTANSLTTGNGTEISSSSVSSGNVVSIAATGTAAASNSKHALFVSTSGANATSSQTTFGAEITNTSTGTSSTNIGLRLTASGGTTNTALDVTAGTIATAGTIVQTSSSSAAFESGPNGSTNPVFRLVNSTASAATGLSITGNAAGSGVTLTALSSGSNEAINLQSKGIAGIIFNPGSGYTVSLLQNGSSAYLSTTVSRDFGFSANNGAQSLTIKASDLNVYLSNGVSLAGSSATNGAGTGDVFFRRNASANWAFGAADAAAPVAQTLSVQNVVGGTSNTAGVNWTFAASRGTGTGAGGDIIFQTAPAGGSGTTQNTLATAFTIQDNGAVQLKSVTFANLPTVANGYLIYCSDCTIASPCASGGSGALAKGINSAWVCN